PNDLQRRRFGTACARLPPARVSALNSSAIFLRGRIEDDLARPGAALYGINPTPYDDENPMQPVVRLRARVLAVREINKRQTVGYNATWQAKSCRRIATAAIGYADGLHRALSNRGAAFFDGKAGPLGGGVSMDLDPFVVTGS